MFCNKVYITCLHVSRDNYSMCTFLCSNKYLENRQVISPDYRHFVCQCHKGMFVNMDFVGVITVCIYNSRLTNTNGNFSIPALIRQHKKMWRKGKHLILGRLMGVSGLSAWYPLYHTRIYTHSKTLLTSFISKTDMALIEIWMALVMLAGWFLQISFLFVIRMFLL